MVTKTKLENVKYSLCGTLEKCATLLLTNGERNYLPLAVQRQGRKSVNELGYVKRNWHGLSYLVLPFMKHDRVRLAQDHWPTATNKETCNRSITIPNQQETECF